MDETRMNDFISKYATQVERAKIVTKRVTAINNQAAAMLDAIARTMASESPTQREWIERTHQVCQGLIDTAEDSNELVRSFSNNVVEIMNMYQDYLDELCQEIERRYK